MNLFEIASREKYRFPYKGMISVEDLWDLTASQLDTVYMALSKEVKAQSEESLMSKTTADKRLSNMIEIVKHIFSVKTEELEQRRIKAENREKRNRIAEILADKQDEALRNMSEEDLKKILAQMES